MACKPTIFFFLSSQHNKTFCHHVKMSGRYLESVSPGTDLDRGPVVYLMTSLGLPPTSAVLVFGICVRPHPVRIYK